MAAGHEEDLFHHVRDFSHVELPGGYHYQLPAIDLFGYHLQLTKFMVLQVVAGLLTLVIFWGLARKVRKGEPVRGGFWNFWETIALYLRDEVVRPTIGHGHPHHPDEDEPDHGHGHHGSAALEEPHKHNLAHALEHDNGLPVSHPADQYLPFIWSCFFYILFCNLLGAVPFLGSATGNPNVTGALALTAFGATFAFGVAAMGPLGFWKNLVPPLDVPGIMKPLIMGLMFVIEVVGLVIKHGVLAVRLFANIMGGHTVLGVMLGFIAAVAHQGVWWLVTPASIMGQVLIGLLELFVAFLQAYVFAFLATIFIGMATHPH